MRILRVELLINYLIDLQSYQEQKKSMTWKNQRSVLRIPARRVGTPWNTRIRCACTFLEKEKRDWHWPAGSCKTPSRKLHSPLPRPVLLILHIVCPCNQGSELTRWPLYFPLHPNVTGDLFSVTERSVVYSRCKEKLQLLCEGWRFSDSGLITLH